MASWARIGWLAFVITWVTLSAGIYVSDLATSRDAMTHYTQWVFLAMIVFFVLATAMEFVEFATAPLLYRITYTMFLPVLLSWEIGVAVAVTYLIPHTRLIDEAIRDHGRAITWVYNTEVHYATVIALFAYLLGKFNSITSTTYWFLSRNKPYLAYGSRMKNTFVGIVLFIIYITHFNINKVYETSLDEITGIAAIGISSVVAVTQMAYYIAIDLNFRNHSTQYKWWTKTTLKKRLDTPRAFHDEKYFEEEGANKKKK